MANTYTQTNLHIVFAVWGRACVIQPKGEEEFEKYITGIVSGPIKTYCDRLYARSHAHSSWTEIRCGAMLFDRAHQNRLDHSHQRGRWIGCRFPWQEGFGAFSTSIPPRTVIDYIHKQKNYHRRESFQQKYVEFLERHNVAYNPLRHF